MPAPKRIFFAQVAPGQWRDWVNITNVGNKEGKVTVIARDGNGKVFWSTERSLKPFQCWTPPVEDAIKMEASLEVISDQPIVGERHCHLGTQVLDFPGAAFELGTVGRRLFFAEVASYIADWMKILNVSEEADALVTVVGHDRSTGRVVTQFTGRVKPKGFWVVGDAASQIGRVTGTLEIISTQPIVAEKHAHYTGGKSAIGQLGQLIEGIDTVAPKRIYFGQIAPGEWYDWVTLTNVGNKEAKITVIARDQNGKAVWSAEKSVMPWQCWIPPVNEAVKNIDVSLEVISDQPVLGERHQHLGTQVLSFPGAAPELGTVGKRLYFPEVYSGAYDWFRFFNVSEEPAVVTFIVRNRDGKVLNQFQHRIKPMGFWTVPDDLIRQATGTVEVLSTAPIMGERHMHYRGWKTAISQLGQVIELA